MINNQTFQQISATEISTQITVLLSHKKNSIGEFTINNKEESNLDKCFLQMCHIFFTEPTLPRQMKGIHLFFNVFAGITENTKKLNAARSNMLITSSFAPIFAQQHNPSSSINNNNFINNLGSSPSTQPPYSSGLFNVFELNSFTPTASHLGKHPHDEDQGTSISKKK